MLIGMMKSVCSSEIPFDDVEITMFCNFIPTPLLFVITVIINRQFILKQSKFVLIYCLILDLRVMCNFARFIFVNR